MSAVAYCPKCNAPMPMKAARCEKCGYDFVQPGEDPPQKQYEFSASQNGTISRLAARIAVVAFGALAVGLVFGFAAATAAYHSRWGDLSMSGLITFVAISVAICGFFAAGSFRSITTSGRSDIDNLMDALQFLSGLFAMVGAVVLGVAAVLLILLIWRHAG